ncbi:MAG: hypothetical protein CBC22_00280 [Alphaproteobacteria bacterium TMED62]|nr:MAG: hypothetical protein CBC22_00280 [Alphaproteobacteria bacterium TMED62]
MKYFFFIFSLFHLSNCFSEDYIIEFQAKVKNLIEYNFSETKNFKNYDLEGTFTDSYGNIGIFGAVIIADIENGKLVRLDSTAENIYSNNERFYFRGIREKSDVDAGIAYNTIIGTTKKLRPLMGTKCTTSVRYLKDAIFGINKCKLNDKSKKILNNIN